MHAILVVEDDRSLNVAIKGKLSREKFEVFSVDNVSDALKILRKEKINAVWLDHYLIGKQSGLDLVHEMKKAKSVWAEIPIFIVSNTAGPEKVQAYIKLGVDKYYTKASTSLAQIIEDIKEVLM